MFRRRKLADSSERSSSEPPLRENPSPKTPKHTVVKPVPIIVQKKGRKRRAGLIFTLGGIFGLILAAFFAERNELISLDMLSDFNLDSVFDVIPAGILKEARDLQKTEKSAINYDSFSVGLHLRAQGVRAKHPVIMIPGVISTGLESWGTSETSRPYFRKRLWGSWTMLRALVLDKVNWKRHIVLDQFTGLDPPGIKLRAAQGFDATDFFVTGYWIWNKILENLATIGYDPQNAFTAAYDWRLSYSNLEVRDQYFSRLKSYIELAYKIENRKVVLVSHSMGSQVLFYFLKWVESDLGGRGGPKWVNDYVDSWINISGCMLGAVKALPAVLSGEMKDTAQLNSFAVYGLEQFLSREERAELFRAMPGMSSMLPKGGDAVWGNATWAPDDRPEQNMSFGTFINFSDKNATTPNHNLTMEGSFKYLMMHTERWFQKMVLRNYSHGIAHTREEVEVNENIPVKWTNPLEARLPNAPDLKIYCFYGVGKPTERTYFYQDELSPLIKLNLTIDTTVTGEGYVSLPQMNFLT
jgi:phospholipid:diacylglycerol acyltransferase